jgi:hypothetical protein
MHIATLKKPGKFVLPANLSVRLSVEVSDALLDLGPMTVSRHPGPSGTMPSGKGSRGPATAPRGDAPA